MENWTARYKGMVAVVLTLLLAVTLVSSYSSTRPAEAAALTNSTWCRYHDSLALLAGSSGTGYLTTGYNSPDGTYQRTEFGWWKRATDLANATWGITSDNYSRNGASVASFLPGGQWPSTTGAVADIGNKQPDLVIISLGTNEYLAQLPPEQFSINLNELITNLRAASSRTSILLTIQWHVARTNPTYPWGQYTSVIYNTAVNRSTAMVDLRQYIPYLPAGATDIAKIYNTDRIHLTDAGQMIVGAAFWTWFFSC